MRPDTGHPVHSDERPRPPLVSVVVPNYNYGAYLGECVESILAQRGFHDLELIVVDDASTDDSLEVLGRIGDPRLVVLRHRENQGHISAINRGFERSRGEYVAHVGADDYWSPDFLAATVPILERNAGVGLVHTNMAMVNGAGEVTEERATNIPVPGGFRGSELQWLLYENYFPPHGTLFRRAGLELIGGGYSPEFPLSEDWRLWLTMSLCYESYFLDEVLVYYRVHGQNLHSSLQRTHRGEESEMRILDEFFARPGIPPEVGALRREVYASRYRRYASTYFGFGQMKACRRSLAREVRTRPGSLLDRGLWKRWAASLVPPPLYRRLQRVTRRGTAPGPAE